MAQRSISQKELKEFLRYDPDTGVFTWIKTRSNRWKPGRQAGCIDGNGYWQIRISGILLLAHRAAFIYMTGDCPKYVDHIDGNKINNKWENLRPCTKSENAFNKPNRIKSYSGIKNVSFDPRINRWYVRLKTNGRIRSFGGYGSLELAELVAFEAREKFHGEFANHRTTFK